jgi:hypothetical protein
VFDHQDELMDRYEVKFQSLWGRPLQPIDCQNLFCETDKYARIAHPDFKGISGRTKIKQKYLPRADTYQLPIPVYPEHWGLRQALDKEFGDGSGGVSASRSAHVAVD